MESGWPGISNGLAETPILIIHREENFEKLFSFVWEHPKKSMQISYAVLFPCFRPSLVLHRGKISGTIRRKTNLLVLTRLFTLVVNKKMIHAIR